MSGVLMICAYRRETRTGAGIEVFEGFALLNEPAPQGVIEIFETQAQAVDAALVLLATPMPEALRF